MRRFRPRPSDLVLGTLVVLAIAGSATAGSLITGAQVKNGTLTLRDFKPSELAKLRGDRGPRGPRGALGPQGPQGLPGSGGAQGSTGSTGAQGATGATGPTGPSDGYTGGSGNDVNLAEEDADTVVATAPAAPGKYIASFSARIINGAGSSAGASVSCSFPNGVGNTETLGAAPDADETLTISAGVEVSGFATGLSVTCEDNSSAGTQTVRGPRLVMVRVGTLTAGS